MKIIEPKVDLINAPEQDPSDHHRSCRMDRMNKPNNPYREGSIIWSVMEGDWEDLTVKQIAEVLDVLPSTVSESMRRFRAT